MVTRLLVVDHALPTPDRDAGSADMFGHLQVLRAAGFEVVLVAPGARAADPYARAVTALGVEVAEVADGEELADVVQRLVPGCAVALLYRAPVAAAVISRVREVSPSTGVVFHAVDLHHVRLEREAVLHGYDLGASEAMRSLELGLVEAADATVVVSTVEHDLLAAAVPSAHVETVPIMGETPRRSRTEAARWAARRTFSRLGPAGRWVNAHEPSLRERRDIVFLGGFAHQPNVDAVHWFVGEVLPLVRAAGVEDRFVVAGYGVPESVAALARDDIAVVGHAPDLADLFATARLSVAPLRIGAGFKGKIVASLSRGVPTVTTSIGAEGGGLVDGYGVFVADEPATLAERIVRLSRDDHLWQRMSEAAYDTFRTRFSHEAGAARLVSIVRRLAR